MLYVFKSNILDFNVYPFRNDKEANSNKLINLIIYKISVNEEKMFKNLFEGPIIYTCILKKKSLQNKTFFLQYLRNELTDKVKYFLKIEYQNISKNIDF